MIQKTSKGFISRICKELHKLLKKAQRNIKVDFPEEKNIWPVIIRNQ